MRRLAVALLSLALLATPLAAGAQEAARVYRIGVVAPGDRPSNTQWHQSTFVQAMREHGYIEGQNLIVERRYAEGRLDRLPAYTAELVHLGADLIVAVLLFADIRNGDQLVVGIGFDGGDRRKTAEILGISYKTLYNKTRKYKSAGGEDEDEAE
jgi:hypothetical protein